MGSRVDLKGIESRSKASAVLTRLANKIACLFRRSHDYQTKREEGWTFLKCGCCGARTAGWHIEPAFNYYKDTRERFRLDFAENVEPENVVSFPPTDHQVSLRLEFESDPHTIA